MLWSARKRRNSRRFNRPIGKEASDARSDSETAGAPATRDLSIDDQRTTLRRRGIIEGNRFLWRIYDEWYRLISACIPDGPGSVLELGSGAGFLGHYIRASSLQKCSSALVSNWFSTPAACHFHPGV